MEKIANFLKGWILDIEQVYGSTIRQWHSLIETTANKLVHLRRYLSAEQPPFREQKKENSLRCIHGLSQASDKTLRKHRVILVQRTKQSLQIVEYKHDGH